MKILLDRRTIALTFIVFFLSSCRMLNGVSLRLGGQARPVEEKLLATMPRSSWNSIVVSPDGQRIAYYARASASSDPTQVVVDGLAGEQFDRVIAGSFTFSPDSRRYAYTAEVGDGTQVVVFDGLKSKPYSDVWDGSLAFSPDSQRVAYLAENQLNHVLLVIDQSETTLEQFPRYEFEEQKKYLLFSPDGRQIAYMSDTNDFAPSNREQVVVGGGEAPAQYKGKYLHNLAFSPDGRHLAYSIALSEYQNSQGVTCYKTHLILDDIKGPGYDEIVPESLAFSADSQRYAYIAVEGAAFSDDSCSSSGSWTWLLSSSFSSDIFTGQLPAYREYTGGQQFIVLDGSAQEKHADIRDGSLLFSPDGKRIAYIGVTKSEAPDLFSESDSRDYVVLDGKREAEYPYIFARSLAFSPDSRRFAYLARAGSALEGQRIVIVDGEAGSFYTNASYPVFSPDSRHYAYAADNGQRIVMIIDGQEQGDYGDIFNDSIRYSPDSTRLAFAATIKESAADGSGNDRMSVVVDGEAGKLYDLVYGSTLGWNADGSLHYLARNGDEFLLVTEKFSN